MRDRAPVSRSVGLPCHGAGAFTLQRRVDISQRNDPLGNLRACSLTSATCMWISRRRAISSAKTSGLAFSSGTLLLMPYFS